MFNKQLILDKYRHEAEICLHGIDPDLPKEKKAQIINREIQDLRVANVSGIANSNSSDAKKLDDILITTYASYVIMLEFRNKVWPYDYMAFSRRIGEIWEPFCKIPFEFPVKELSIYTPPQFKKVQKALNNELSKYISGLEIDSSIKTKLFDYYQKVWTLVDSGNISLKLDLHFKQDNKYYNIDYKSGFSSNEKGNTNRLLMVASIYNSLPDDHNNLIFVRQSEEENNHYLQTLKSSPFWKVYCADATYEQIKHFTGYDLKAWMNKNMDWEQDISGEFHEYLKNRDLLKYLTW